MIVEKIPIQRSWDFYEDDDVTITFSMKDAGVLISLAGCTAFSQIREEQNSTSTLVAQGSASITDDIITVVYAKADLAAYLASTVYGDIRIVTADSKYITLLSFSAAIQPTISREVAP